MRCSRRSFTEPLAQRHKARREAEALRPEAERLVAELFAELREPAQVVAQLRADQSLGDARRPCCLPARLAWVPSFRIRGLRPSDRLLATSLKP